MYFGELEQHSEDYQAGHSSGSARALDFARSCFEKMDSKQKFTGHDVSEILYSLKLDWQNYCDTFGMGIEEEEEEEI